MTTPARPRRRLGVTERQHQALEYIRSYIAEHGFSPTYAEIGQGIGLAPTSKARVYEIVNALADRGQIVLSRDARRWRSITLPDF